MKKVKVSIYQLVNFNRKSDRDKAGRVRLIIEKVVNDQAFREKILDAEFKDRRFLKVDGTIVNIDDNRKVLDMIIGGKEQYREEDADYEWDMSVALYRSLTREVGHRKRETIFTKKRKFRKATDEYVAAHWIHEYAHVIGFIHDFKNTEIRPFSIPYLIYDIAERMLNGKR